LGHANYKATYLVARGARQNGTPVNISSAPPKCDACILGKQTRRAVPKSREGVRSKEKGEAFFVDAAGTQNVRSATGNTCPLDIIDDCTSYGWSFPVASKADCGPKLKAFIIAR
ncbi:uncharacterized protein TRAVEDRAFT_82838, partial [Trametes versicolor FP-101664 SS1]|uniref:uncharacterized protein n=1 Tax=Trametes versicolor (strain FP-101664) TaxID=717944 RepID=UPI000462484F